VRGKRIADSGDQITGIGRWHGFDCAVFVFGCVEEKI